LISITSAGKVTLGLLSISRDLVLVSSIRRGGIVHDLLDIRGDITLNLRVHLTSLLLLLGGLGNRVFLVSEAQAVSTLVHLLGRLLSSKLLGLIGVRGRKNFVLILRVALRSLGIEFNLPLRFESRTA
jgi:hypothetical protein